MDDRQISEHEIRVYEAVRLHGGWQTAREIAAAADVASRTARQHAGRLGELGVFEVKKVFGGYRYRIDSRQDSGAVIYTSDLEDAKAAFDQ